MNRGLPQELFERILSPLPLVDVFRLRRVSQRFDRFLVPRLRTLDLDYAELGFQFGERSIRKRLSTDLVGRILAHYGESVLTLKVCLHVEKADLDDQIANCCPKLVELEILCCQAADPYFPFFHEWPARNLFQLPELKVLKAKLTLLGSESDDAARLFDRLLGMEVVSSISLRSEEAWFLDTVRGVPSLKQISLHDGFTTNYFERFCGLESVQFVGKPSDAVLRLLPANLKKLDFANRKKELQLGDLEVLSRFLHLKEFACDSSHQFPNFSFLGHYTELESIHIMNDRNALMELVSCIPSGAPLRHVNGHRWGSLDDAEPLLTLIENRKFALETFCISFPCNFPEIRLIRFLGKMSSSLQKFSLFVYPGPADRIIEQMNEELVARLTHLDLRCTRATAGGVLSLLHCRKRLVEGASLAGGKRLPLLCLFLDGGVLEGCRNYEELSQNALVVFMRRDGQCHTVDS